MVRLLFAIIQEFQGIFSMPTSSFSLASRPLMPFDKLNLAVCAKLRAEQNVTTERFYDEYRSSMAWMRHRQINEPGGRYGYISG